MSNYDNLELYRMAQEGTVMVIHHLRKGSPQVAENFSPEDFTQDFFLLLKSRKIPRKHDVLEDNFGLVRKMAKEYLRTWSYSVAGGNYSCVGITDYSESKLREASHLTRFMFNGIRSQISGGVFDARGMEKGFSKEYNDIDNACKNKLKDLFEETKVIKAFISGQNLKNVEFKKLNKNERLKKFKEELNQALSKIGCDLRGYEGDMDEVFSDVLSWRV